MSDQINPSHYKRFPGVEVIQITRHLDFDSGNAVKYICRAGFKDGQDELVDLEKALWYLNDRIADVKRRREADPPVLPPVASQSPDFGDGVYVCTTCAAEFDDDRYADVDAHRSDNPGHDDFNLVKRGDLWRTSNCH